MITELIRKDGTQVDAYTLPHTDAGLEHCLILVPSLRKAGYKTFLREENILGWAVYLVLAFPPKRPNRKERGASL
jgi:hypothetical protein